MARRLFPDSRDRYFRETKERRRKDLREENKRTQRTKVTRPASIADPPHVIANATRERGRNEISSGIGKKTRENKSKQLMTMH
jgi:hypothetical protein